MMTTSARPLSTMVRARLCWRSLSSERSKSSDMPIIPFIGVRNSWLTFARNEDLASLEAAASLSATLSFSVRCLRICWVWRKSAVVV